MESNGTSLGKGRAYLPQVVTGTSSGVLGVLLCILATRLAGGQGPGGPAATAAEMTRAEVRQEIAASEAKLEKQMALTIDAVRERMNSIDHQVSSITANQREQSRKLDTILERVGPIK